MRRQSLPLTPVKALAAACVLLLAFVLGRASDGIGLVRAEDEIAMQTTGSPDAVATATRQAELAEVSDLRTQVANGPACTPAASESASPTPVPPVAAGTPVPYGDDWTVTVVDVSLMPTFGDTTAKGVYAKVSIIATNNISAPLRFPYDDLALRDARGRVLLSAFEVKIQNESNYFVWFPPSVPTSGFVVFDAPADAQGPFILESATDPTFRVLIDVEERG